jgi:hypothetical protein
MGRWCLRSAVNATRWAPRRSRRSPMEDLTAAIGNGRERCAGPATRKCDLSTTGSMRNGRMHRALHKQNPNAIYSYLCVCATPKGNHLDISEHAAHARGGGHRLPRAGIGIHDATGWVGRAASHPSPCWAAGLRRRGCGAHCRRARGRGAARDYFAGAGGTLGGVGGGGRDLADDGGQATCHSLRPPPRPLLSRARPRGSRREGPDDERLLPARSCRPPVDLGPCAPAHAATRLLSMPLLALTSRASSPLAQAYRRARLLSSSHMNGRSS